MPFPLQVEQNAIWRKPPDSRISTTHPVQRVKQRGFSPLRGLKTVCRGRQADSSYATASAGSEASLLRLALPYRSAVVIADFVATGDSFHRRLAQLASDLATRICLVQHPAPASSDQDTHSTEILLEGLRHRLGLDPAHCIVVADATQLKRFVSPDARDLVVFGAAQSTHGVTSARPDAHAHGLDCDVMHVEDELDWDLRAPA